ncbi:MAG TPA: hypothetical protein EYG98_03045 [Sulfurovum sp.]|nr:hypothetical protein [Sulfurovum sp.]
MTILTIDIHRLVYLIPLTFILLSIVTKTYKKDITLIIFDSLILVDAYLYTRGMMISIIILSMIVITFMHMRAIYNKTQDDWIKR